MSQGTDPGTVNCSFQVKIESDMNSAEVYIKMEPDSYDRRTNLANQYHNEYGRAHTLYVQKSFKAELESSEYESMGPVITNTQPPNQIRTVAAIKMEPMIHGLNGSCYSQAKNSSPWCFSNLETPTTSSKCDNEKSVTTLQSPQLLCKSLGGEAWELADKQRQECTVQSPGVLYCPTTASPGAFNCEICGEKFTNRSLSITHKQTHSNEVEQERTVNRKLYGPNKTTQDESHTDIELFTCEICNAKFRHPSLLVSHKRIHSNDKPFKCEMCNEKFTDANMLRSHTRIHNSDRLFTCEVCNRNFADARNLMSHKRIHTGERPYTCDLCNIKFTDIRNLKSHKLVHSGEKPFTCKICNAKCTKISNLKSHTLIHTGDRPFNCDLCDAKFTKYINLKTHIRVHTGERPFECEICNAKFAAAGNLKRHKERHTGEKSFICVACSKCFSRARDLKRHAATC